MQAKTLRMPLPARCCSRSRWPRAYRDAARRHTQGRRYRRLAAPRQSHDISLFTVYRQAQAYAQAAGLPALPLNEKTTSTPCATTSVASWSAPCCSTRCRPSLRQYVAAAHNVFGSEFFALRRLLHARGTGPAYLQQLLDIPLSDAAALHHR